MKAVLVHGIFSTHRILFSMRRTLERNGVECFAPDLKPNDGRTGIEDLARQLRDHIDAKLDTAGRFVLIGFSMGGIVSRYYLQYLDGFKRVDHFFSISTPHHGTITAYLYPGRGTQQLRPNSPFLRGLEESQEVLRGLKLYSYWTPFDWSILPASSSHWEIAENKEFSSLLHPLMLFDKSVVNEIIFQVHSK